MIPNALVSFPLSAVSSTISSAEASAKEGESHARGLAIEQSSVSLPCMRTGTNSIKPATKKTTVRIDGRAVVLEKSPVSGLFRKPPRLGEKPVSRSVLSKALDHAL